MEKIKITIKYYILAIKNWIKKNPLEAGILFFILFVGAFAGLYKIDQYMTFLGDEGRDVIVVRRLLVYGDPILVGPGTSIGNMYLGPLYYYMMAPALLLAGFSPIGPAIQIAVLGIFTIFFVWYVGREWFGKLAGVVSASLYAIAPTVIIFSRSSWNPNIMPFFALTSIYSIWEVWQKKYRWLIVLGISYAFVLQSHYLGLLLAPTLGIFWLLTFLREKEERRKLFRNSLIGLILFLFLMSPLVIFDARHGWRNFSAMEKFLTERQSTVSFRPWNALPQVPALFDNINTRLLAGRNETVGVVISVAIVISLVWLLWLFKKNKLRISPKPLAVLFLWLGFALIGLGLYKQQIYDHYYGFFFPAPFLLLGAISQRLVKIDGKLIKILLSISFILLVIVNLSDNPLRYPPNNQLQRSITVATKIKDEAVGKPFDLAVLAERNYEDGYKYFLDVWGLKVLHADIWDKSTIADQLFVVCEKPKEKCDPTHDPKAEVANFGMSKIENQWDVGGVILYKLVHSK